MTRQFALFLAGFAVLTALPAEARFGKRSKPPPPSQSNQNPSPQSPSPAPAPQYQSGSTGYARHYHHRPRYYGPRWGVGYGYAYGSAAAPAVVAAEPVQAEPPSSGIRLTTGAEAMGFKTGFTLGALVAVEGDRWGFAASGQNIAVATDDGTPGMDHIQQATAHLTFAFLTGQYGRMRVELGADAVFAPNMISLGPTGGVSGVLWIGGPFAVEGAVMITPWPYQQLDGKLGLALGLGPVGLRAGARLQVLDDRGMVDGIVHRDVFFGPYVGASVVF
jgi:hypothetical protein